jgi:isopenicillin N synthase-like dioxygenase
MARDTHGTQHTGCTCAPLPVIDLQDFPTGDSESRQATANAIGAACETIGFIYVANHGVPQQTIDAALEATRNFFARSAEAKRALARVPGTYRGYIPMMPFSEDRDSGERYLYEAFITGPELAAEDCPEGGMRWPNLWPGDSTELSAALSRYYRALSALSESLLEAFPLALGQPDDALRAFFTRPMTNISLLHYPARPAGGRLDGANARPHYDTNALTILLPGAAGGLELEHHQLGWSEVPPRPGCFVVNIGNMMEVWSAGRFRSTMHRVRPPAESRRRSTPERRSIPSWRDSIGSNRSGPDVSPFTGMIHQPFDGCLEAPGGLAFPPPMADLLIGGGPSGGRPRNRILATRTYVHLLHPRRVGRQLQGGGAQLQGRLREVHDCLESGLLVRQRRPRYRAHRFRSPGQRAALAGPTPLARADDSRRQRWRAREDRYPELADAASGRD